MPLLPMEPIDFALAPVAVQLDKNLARIRGMTPEQIGADLALQLNDDPRDDPGDRADRVRSAAMRFVKMHGWDVEVTSDYSRLRLTGGSMPIELGLSGTIRDYIVG